MCGDGESDGNAMNESEEHLASIKLKDGDTIDFLRDHSNGSVSICRDGHRAVMPKATGLQAANMFALLEPLGIGTEFPDE